MTPDKSEHKYNAMMAFILELYKLEDTGRVVSAIVDHAVKLLNADRSTLYLLDKDTNVLHSEFYHGAPQKKIKLALDENSVAGYCGCHKKTVNIVDVYKPPYRGYPGLRFNAFYDRLNRYNTRSILSVPLLDDNGRLKGVLSVINSLSPSGFSKEDASMLEAVARHAVVAVSRLERQELARVFSQDAQTQLSGRQRLFVVFFDIIDYTRLSESQGDAKIKKIIQAWEENHIRLINDYGGIYVKSAGDEIMSLFGLEPHLASLLPEKELSDTGLPVSSHDIFRKKRALSNEANLKQIIYQYWYCVTGKPEQTSRQMTAREKGVMTKLWAENVVRFMHMAQKNLDRLNYSLFERRILTREDHHRILMRGGAEYGPVIVGFDFYGRIDVLGDTVNVASRITDAGNKRSMSPGIDDQPVFVGPKLNSLLPSKAFANRSRKYTRLKGKSAPIYIYSVNSIQSFDNRALIPAKAFAGYKAYILKQIRHLDRVKQHSLPFNFASYRIEQADKYLVDHSKRVAVNCVHIIDLMRGANKVKDMTRSFKKDTVISALLHDIGRHSLSDQIKAYIDPTKSIRKLTPTEKETFNRLTSSFGCSILESITELRPYADRVKYAWYHYNGTYNDPMYKAVPCRDRIPLESRIIAVANAIDAILSDTPFREKKQIEELVSIFESDMAASDFPEQVQKFDPGILAPVIRFYRQGTDR